MITDTEEELAGSVTVPAAVTDPLNLVVDRRANRVLTFDAGTQEFVAIKLTSSGVPDPASVGRFNAHALRLQAPRGLTMDPASGQLYVLDSSGQRIVRVDPAPDQSLDMTEALNEGRVSTIDLRPADVVGAQGLAFNPADGHLYVLSRAKHALYELTQTGQVVAARDLADSDDFALIDPAGMVFAPSGDSTDDPANQSLYIADSRVGDTSRRPGQIMELSLAEAQASAVASTIVPTLVHTTFTSQWSSPSPDPMGGAYIPTSGRLMISDSEIEEYQRPYWNGGNIFSSTRQGAFLPPVQDITNFTNEPTGIAFNPSNNHLFISDDNMKEVFEVNPGNDGNWFTGDDSRTQFDTKVLGTNDTEDVAYNPFNGYLYLADGLNSEVWEVRPGANNRFDGVPPAGDDQASHWDTSSKSINDPEGITVNTDTGTLYVTGHGATKVIETTIGGTLLNVYDIAFIKSLYGRMQPSGLAYGPSSVNPGVKNLYITDRAVDNDADPRENDGKIHEITLGGGGPGDSAPAVLSTTPGGGATNVALGANITVNFSEAVTTSGAWFNISCATSGAHTAIVSGGPQSFTLNPDTDFAQGESCTVRVFASLVTDQDSNDPPDTMAADVVWSFTTTQPGPPPTTGAIYLSLANSGAYTVGSVTGVHDEDIVYFDGANWSMFFDGSDVSVTGEVDAFHIVDGNTILFSLAAAAPVGSLGTVEAADIVQFDGTFGAATSGAFSMFLDGSTVGLDTSAENIDGIEVLSDGRVVVSTTGNAGVVTGARDEDLLALTPTSGAWAMYFDGSDVDLATTTDEDVDGVDIAGSGAIHLSTRGPFAVNGVSGDDEDVFVCAPTSLGDVTSCNYSPTLYFDGSAWGLASNDVDAINLP